MELLLSWVKKLPPVEIRSMKPFEFAPIRDWPPGLHVSPWHMVSSLTQTPLRTL